MRIAQIAPLTEAVPPKLYGGTERVISWLTEALVEAGHDVTLFASGDSVTAAKLESVWPRALRLDGSVCEPNALHMSMLETVARRASEFDLLHFHLDYYPFSLFSRLETPFVTTMHGRLDLPEHQTVFRTFPSAPIVSISYSQRKPLPHAAWVGTVHHGAPEQLLTPTGRRPEYEQIKPLLHAPKIEFVGEISDGEKSEFLSPHAMASIITAGGCFRTSPNGSGQSISVSRATAPPRQECPEQGWRGLGADCRHHRQPFGASAGGRH